MHLGTHLCLFVEDYALKEELQRERPPKVSEYWYIFPSCPQGKIFQFLPSATTGRNASSSLLPSLTSESVLFPILMLLYYFMYFWTLYVYFFPSHLLLRKCRLLNCQPLNKNPFLWKFRRSYQKELLFRLYNFKHPNQSAVAPCRPEAYKAVCKAYGEH